MDLRPQRLELCSAERALAPLVAFEIRHRMADWIGGVRIGGERKAQPFSCAESHRFDAAVGFGDVG